LIRVDQLDLNFGGIAALHPSSRYRLAASGRKRLVTDAAGDPIIVPLPTAFT
jgi:hypothetical protein